MNFTLPKFNNKKELFKYLVEKEEYILEEKFAALKEADGCGVDPIIATNEVGVAKSESGNEEDLMEKEVLDATLIINTTNIMDSHKDVHIPGLWDKTLKENKRIRHLQEHRRGFKDIIADKGDLKAYTKTFTWKELGYNAEGKTQALVFDSKIKKSRNAYMHEQYAKGHVDNHSVGMRYVKIKTCINDEDYPEYKENWDKYIDEVVNQADAEKSGYFWAVLEAKCVEGSAVVDGSNFVTPTQSIKNIETTSEEVKSTSAKEKAILNWLQK